MCNEHFGHLFDLVEVRSEECLVDNQIAARMTDFVFSVCGNSVLGCLKQWAMGQDEVDLKGRDIPACIMKAMREEYEMLAEEHFPDGRLYLTYMYFVVRRKARV